MMDKEVEEANLRKDQLVLKFKEQETVLAVAVKLPGELPRVLPVTIEDVRSFLEEEFNDFWTATKQRVQSELIRGVT